ncbi:roundabout homolog 1-like isoform X2 [Acanthaster planci]|uniref:Roundabout homolog 1-like isoform X2 n=1 Tax=Acanthaster planci TaxID=133434 RepID=A0A8B7YX51_ACAPL|nr:roundabout homolog 1-like isoform X2 [Acanthaster planci]
MKACLQSGLDTNTAKTNRLSLFGLVFLLWNCSMIASVIGAPGGNRREDYPPRITEHPQSVIVPRGEPTTLRCRADGRPDPTITWLKDGERLDLLSGDGHRSMLNPGELFFLRVIHSKGNNADVGTYQCVATNYLGEAVSNNATLEVTYIKDDFRREPVPTEVEGGEPVVLECQPPRGYPEPTVTWSKDDEDVIVDGDRVKVLQDGNLMISQSRASDAGSYVCTASNQMGSRSTDPVYLTVKAPPLLVHPVQDIMVGPGTTVLIGCDVIGDPIPVVTWSKQSGELPPGRYSILEDNSLRIRQVTQEDEGVYVCEAVNSNGRVQDDMMLTVSVIPTFTQAPMDRTVEIHHTASFQCQATGSPTPAIVWKKEGSQEELLFVDMQSGRLQVTSDGELHVTDVREEDEGYYVCTAHSGSSVIEARAFLRVIASVSQPPPIINYGPSNQTLIVGTVALLTCETAGNPAPSVRWTKNGAPLHASDTRFTVLDTGRLQISGLFLEDSGMYSCIATNSSGQTSWRAYLRVIERSEASDIPVLQAPNIHELPASPGQPTASNITRTSLTLSWLPPSRTSPPLSPITHYRLEYFSHEVASEWQIVPAPCMGQTCLVQQLRPGTTYLFLVRAVNDRGIGPPGPISQPITTRDVLSAIPSEQSTLIEEWLQKARVDITNAMVLSPTAVKVLWEVRQHHEFIEGYHLKYFAASDTNGFTMQTVLGSTNKIITGLTPNTGYTITVQPFNSGLNGPESDPVDVDTHSQGDELPESLIDNPVLQGKLNTCGTTIVSIEPIGSTSLKITWRVSKNEPYIDGYHIKYSVQDSHDMIIQTVTGSNIKLLTDLTPWTWYRVTIQPFNGLYLGPESPHQDARTQSGVPTSAPRNVQVVNNGTAAILVTWNPPLASTVQGVIAGYNVYCLAYTAALHKNVTTEAGQLSVRVTRLLVGEVYKLSVAAFTTAGEGPSSSVIRVQITQGGGDGLDWEDDGDDSGSIVTQPWFIASLAVFFLLILLCIIVFVWRRRKQYKLAGTISKGPISRDNAAAAHNMGIGSSGQFVSSNHSSVQSSLQRSQGWVNPSQRPLPSTVGLLSDTSDHHGNRPCVPIGSASSSLNRAEYLQPNNTAYWLLEAYDPESGTLRQYDTQQPGSNGRRCHQCPPSHSCYGSGGPVYAVVDNADDDDEDAVYAGDVVHGPHSALTLPMPRCPEHTKEKLTVSNSLPPHVTEPYASTTLIMPTNVSEMRPPCSHSGSSEQSAGSSQSAARKDHRGRHNPADSSSGGSTQQGDRVSRKKRHRGGSNQPARNWTELLPPPPEQPPTDIDSPTEITCPAPTCSHAPTNLHMEQAKYCQDMERSKKKAPPPPLRQCCSSPPVSASDRQQTVPSHRQPPTNSLPKTLNSNRSSTPVDRRQQPHSEVSDRPSDPDHSQRGVPYLASKRLFEDPRHEQLGKELLEFNDDMSQSEILSDNEDLTGMLPTSTSHVDQGLHHNPVGYMPSGSQIPHLSQTEDDTDCAGSCTDAMLGSWSSMNGSSSSGRHSSVSESSEGSFFTDADFASAVAAAAQNSGMQVVGSTVTDPRTGKKHSRHGGRHGHTDQARQAAHAAGGIEMNGTSQSSPAKTSQSHPLVLQDTNGAGLTVTANPLAFAMEDSQM